jgi:hypothetical protein
VKGDLSNIETIYLNRVEAPRGNFWVAVEETDGKEVMKGIVGLEYKTNYEAELRRLSVANDLRRMVSGSTQTNLSLLTD